MTTNLSPDESEILRSLDAATAAAFLHERLKAVDALIGEREKYLGEVYPEGSPRHSGEADVTEVYRQERRIVQELLAKQETSLSRELGRRLERARDRWEYLEDANDWPIRSASERRRRLAAWTEERILAELLGLWEAWLKERQAQGARAPHQTQM